MCICAKNDKNWLAVDKVIAEINRLTFSAHPVIVVRASHFFFGGGAVLPTVITTVYINTVSNYWVLLLIHLSHSIVISLKFVAAVIFIFGH